MNDQNPAICFLNCRKLFFGLWLKTYICLVTTSLRHSTEVRITFCFFKSIADVFNSCKSANMGGRLYNTCTNSKHIQIYGILTQRCKTKVLPVGCPYPLGICNAFVHDIIMLH